MEATVAAVVKPSLVVSSIHQQQQQEEDCATLKRPSQEATSQPRDEEYNSVNKKRAKTIKEELVENDVAVKKEDDDADTAKASPIETRNNEQATSSGNAKPAIIVKKEEEEEEETAKEGKPPAETIAVAIAAGCKATNSFAIPTTEPPLPPRGILFDFGSETTKIWAQNEREDGLHWERFSQHIMPLHKRSRACYYFYRNERTFLAVIELWNRMLEQQKYKPWIPVPVSHVLQRKDRYDSCSNCERKLCHLPSPYCLLDKNGPHLFARAETLCLGCAGRSCAFLFGNDTAFILSQWKQQQQEPTTLKPQEQLGSMDQLAQQLHLRQDCVVHPFCNDDDAIAKQFCPNCLCYVCQVPARECPQWAAEHCHAIQSDLDWDYEYEKRHEELNKPAGLFDYDEEEQELKRRNKFAYNMDAVHERAKACQYYFADKTAFCAALELYNRQSCRLDTPWSWRMNPLEKRWTPRLDFRLKKPRGGGLPCSQCQKSFDGGRQKRFPGENYYLLHHTKVCMGCMGRNLCYKFGSRRATIVKKLQEYRKKQEPKRTDDMVVVENFLARYDNPHDQVISDFISFG